MDNLICSNSQYLLLDVSFDYNTKQTMYNDYIYIHYGETKIYSQELIQIELNNFNLFQTSIENKSVKLVFLLTDNQFKTGVSEVLPVQIYTAMFTIYTTDFD